MPPNGGFLMGRVAFRSAVAGPEFLGGRELIEWDFARDGAACGSAVVLKEGVAVRTVGEGKVENLGIFERLRHTGSDGVVVVLGFENGEREVRFIGEEVVGFFRFTAFHRLSPHDDAALSEIRFFADLSHHIPLGVVRTHQRGRDELGADVSLGERFFVHAAATKMRPRAGAEYSWDFSPELARN